MAARCLQHEVDHLNGTVYVDLLPEDAAGAVCCAEAPGPSGDLPGSEPARPLRPRRHAGRLGARHPRLGPGRGRPSSACRSRRPRSCARWSGRRCRTASPRRWACRRRTSYRAPSPPTGRTTSAGAMLDVTVVPGHPGAARPAARATTRCSPWRRASRSRSPSAILEATSACSGRFASRARRHARRRRPAQGPGRGGRTRGHPDGTDPVLVGDRAQDVLGAAAHGLPCIGAGWGPAEDGELEAAGAAVVAATPADVLAGPGCDDVR